MYAFLQLQHTRTHFIQAVHCALKYIIYRRLQVSGYHFVSADSEHDIHPQSNRIYKFGVVKIYIF